MYMHFIEYMVGLLQEVVQMTDLLIMAGIIGGWVVLQKYILPRLGVST